MPTRPLHFYLVRLLPVLVVAVAGARAIAQSDPPSRVGRLNHSEGAVVYAPTGDNEWTDASPNRPLTRGDRLWTDKRSRAEVQVGSSAVRLDGQTHLEILALDDQSAQLSLTQGSVYLRIRSLPEGENFEIDTPNLAYRAAYPGDYRIDVDPVNGTTRVTIHSGTGAVYGEGGQVQPLGGGQQVTFKARALAQAGSLESPPQDNFDRWAADRNRREDQAVSARYVPREVVGYQQLDAHGQWAQDATHGNVWFPQNMPANWAPYRVGRWEWIAPWGWTWLDEAPWGFAPFHYGRWAVVGSRWAWVPGRIGLKPAYAPALVAFVGGGSNDWNLPVVSGKPAVAWFPLAPGEAWQPPYAASPVYLSNINRNLTLQANATYAHQRSAEALTAIPADDFNRGKPARAGWLQIAANTLTNARVVPPPPMPAPSATHPQAAAAKVVPPAQAQARQVIADSASARQADATQRQAQAAAQAAAHAASQAQVVAGKQARAQAQQAADADRARIAAEQRAPAPKVAEAAKAVEPAKVVAVAPKTVAPPQANADEQAKQADQARRAERQRAAELAKAEQAKVAEKTRRAEQAKAAELARAEQAKADEQARRDKQAKREQAKREQVAKRAEQAKREQLAKQAETAKREQLARQAEAAKREQVAKREQAKREQVAKRAEQAKREVVAKREEQQRHAQQVEQARRAADRDAQVLAEQRAKRESQEREVAQLREREKREQAQREAEARQQQALAEQWRRDRQAMEQQQQRVRQRPDLRDDKRPRSGEQPRGIPIISSGPLS